MTFFKLIRFMKGGQRCGKECNYDTRHKEQIYGESDKQ